MTRNIDGALALVYAQWAQKNLAEAEMGDQAEEVEKISDLQEKVRGFRNKLNKALDDGAMSLHEMRDLTSEAKALGLPDAEAALDKLFRMTKIGQAKTASTYSRPTPTWDSAEQYLESVDDKPPTQDGTFIWINENGTAEHDVERTKEIKRIREAMTDRLDTLKSKAAGKELDLQMASQEYSRSSQLASNLLNTRNEALKVFAQALSRA